MYIHVTCIYYVNFDHDRVVPAYASVYINDEKHFIICKI